MIDIETLIKYKILRATHFKDGKFYKLDVSGSYFCVHNLTHWLCTEIKAGELDGFEIDFSALGSHGKQ